MSYKSPFIKNEMLQAMVRGLGHEFNFALPSSRTVALTQEARRKGAFLALDTVAFPEEQPLRVWLRSLEEAVLVVRQVFTNKDGSRGMLYLVSSDTDLSWKQR